MTNRQFASSSAFFVFAICMAWVARAHGQEPQPDSPPAGQEQGMEVMARGPIHEAFAEPVDARPQPGLVVPKQPPDAVEEMPPDQKPEGSNVQWIGGYWAWDDDRSDFLWVSGIWRAIPPDRQWMPGHWTQVNNGWQWVGGYWAAMTQSNEVRYLPPPPAPLNTGISVPAPTPESVYVPGTWVYDDTRYLYAWRAGYWVTYRPGWIWVPAHYIWTPAGYIFVEGYWDYVIAKRGLLFAPIYFTSPLWTRPGWYYRPSYCIWDNFLLTALFIRPGYCHYYFGDYFETGYARLGFTPWFEFRFGRYDPLFSYYRWSNRTDPGWAYNMKRLYADRFSGQATRPPRTLVQQTTIINNSTVNNVTINNVKNVTVLAPLSAVNGKMVTLRSVPKADLAKEQNHAKQLAVATKQHSQLERQLVVKGASTKKVNTTPQTVKIDLPKRPIQTQVGRTITPPSPPPPPHPIHTTTTVIRPDTRRPVIEERIKPKVEDKAKTKADDKNKGKG